MNRLKLSRKGDTGPMLWIIIIIVLGLVVAAILIWLAKDKTSDLNQGTSCVPEQCNADAPCQSGYVAGLLPCKEKVGEDVKIGRCCVAES